MKFAVVALCSMFIVSTCAQNLGEIMALSAMLGNRGSSNANSASPLGALTGSGSSSPANPIAALTSSSGSTGNQFASLSSNSRGNQIPSLMGGNMGRMAGGMMLGGAELSNMVDFYACGMYRMPMHLCFMMAQQNM